jgi:hypothetical protein
MTPPLWAALVPAIITLLLALAAYLRANTAVSKIGELHVLVNSRLTQLLQVTAQAAQAQGVAQGQANAAASNPRNIAGIGGKE